MLLTGDECASILDVCEQFCDKADAKSQFRELYTFSPKAKSPASPIPGTI